MLLFSLFGICLLYAKFGKGADDCPNALYSQCGGDNFQVIPSQFCHALDLFTKRIRLEGIFVLSSGEFLHFPQYINLSMPTDFSCFYSCFDLIARWIEASDETSNKASLAETNNKKCSKICDTYVDKVFLKSDKEEVAITTTDNIAQKEAFCSTLNFQSQHEEPYNDSH
jgi:hypothetical protein